MRPIAHADGSYRIGRPCELFPSLACCFDNGVIMVEDPVRDPIGPHILPDVLDRVQLWHPRRQLPFGCWRLDRGPWGGVLIPMPQETWYWGFQLASLTFGIDPSARGHGLRAMDIDWGSLDLGCRASGVVPWISDQSSWIEGPWPEEEGVCSRGAWAMELQPSRVPWAFSHVRRIVVLGPRTPKIGAGLQRLGFRQCYRPSMC